MSSSCLQIVFIVIVIRFIHLDHRIMPNDTAPFVGLADKLQRRLGMPGIALDARVNTYDRPQSGRYGVVELPVVGWIV